MNKYSLIVAFALLLGYACTPEQENVVKIDTENIISTDFIGNGVQWSAYPHADTENSEWGLLMTDEKWEMNFNRLDYMQPKLFRVLDQANWRYLVGFDEQGNPILDFETEEVKALEKILDYAQENDIAVLFGEWGTPFKMHDTDQGHSDKFTDARDPKWINSIVSFLDYLINTKGYTCLKYYNLINEPNGHWASNMGDFNEWRDGVVLLNEALKEKGLDKYISVAGPDAVTRYDNPESTYPGLGWVEETAKQIPNDVGIYEIHDYTDHNLVQSGEFRGFHKKAADIAKAQNKQIIFGELGMTRSGDLNQKRAQEDPFASEDSQMEVLDFKYGIYMADAAIQSLNAGFSGIAAWALDDAMHTLGDLGNKHELKRWGMWNSLGTEICNDPSDENIRPWFYSWSLICRYFPTGSEIVYSDNTNIEGVRLSVGKYENELTIALVNNSKVDATIALEIPSENTFKRFLYQEGNSKVDENGFPLPVQTNMELEGISSVEVPANSFVLLTSLKH